MTEPFRPRVIHDEDDRTRPAAAAERPNVFPTAETERVVPRERSPVAQVSRAELAPVRRRDGWVRLGLTELGVAIAGWIGVDAYLWISNAFVSSPTLGWAATGFVAAGVAGAALVCGRELRSYFSLTSVEANQHLLAHDAALRPAELRKAVRDVLAVVPRDRESEAAIESYQRQAQPHHTPAQRLELLSRTVMTPLDRRAEAVVRRYATRAFGITAVSPTALTDAVFFIAMSVRMVRGIAACYGHRPTATATLHLLRRLVVEAGRLGAVDLAGMSLAQLLGGAVAERLAASAAESVYAGQRMARLGLVTMSMCRPVPFRPQEVPGLYATLIGNLFARNREP